MNKRQQAVEVISQSKDSLGNAVWWLPDDLRAALSELDVALIERNHFVDAATVSNVLEAV